MAGGGLRAPGEESLASIVSAVVETGSSSVRPGRRAGLGAVLVTHEREGECALYLDRLVDQSAHPDTVVVVDNSPPARQTAHRHVLANRWPFDVVCLAPASNGGPAGGYNLGVLALDRDGVDRVLLLDDDDPPISRTAVEVVDRAFVGARKEWPSVGGVGFRGARFHPRSATTRLPPTTGGTRFTAVDHLHGGYLPVYDLAAFAGVGGFDPGLFWGFEELDLGRRLTAGRHELWALHAECADHCSTRKARGRRVPDYRAETEAQWSGRMLKARNLAKIAVDSGAWTGVAAHAVRVLGRAGVYDARARSTRHVRSAGRALVAGIAGGDFGVGRQR